MREEERKVAAAKETAAADAAEGPPRYDEGRVQEVADLMATRFEQHLDLSWLKSKDQHLLVDWWRRLDDADAEQRKEQGAVKQEAEQRQQVETDATDSKGKGGRGKKAAQGEPGAKPRGQSEQQLQLEKDAKAEQKTSDPSRRLFEARLASTSRLPPGTLQKSLRVTRSELLEDIARSAISGHLFPGFQGQVPTLDA